VAQFPPGCAVRANKVARAAVDRGAPDGVGMSFMWDRPEEEPERLGHPLHEQPLRAQCHFCKRAFRVFAFPARDIPEGDELPRFGGSTVLSCTPMENPGPSYEIICDPCERRLDIMSIDDPNYCPPEK
jgi:hypothetical protein